MSDSTKGDLPVYLVGLPYTHHSAHSGYEGFQRYAGRALRTRLGFRYLERAWRLDLAVSALTRKPSYSVALMIGEVATGLHMLAHPNAVYHVIYADTDLRLLGQLGRLTRTPVVGTFHESEPGLEWLKVDGSILRGLAAVILVSESQRTYFEAFVAPERIFVVPHGIDTNFFRPTLAAPDEPMCITVGSKFRDFEALSDAISIVRDADPAVQFVAVGTGRDKRNPFRDDRVRYLDDVSDEALLATYHKSRIAVLPLTRATANNALLEAMACGLPVVATDIGGVREYIGSAGALFCPPHDAASLAGAILSLSSDPALAARMGAANRAQVTRFDYRNVARLHRQVYEFAAT